MKKKQIHVSSAPRPVGAYPHARRVGDLLFLSGIGPRDPETDEVPGLKRSASGMPVALPGMPWWTSPFF